MSVTPKDIAKAASRAGLDGRPVLVHSSLRSFGWVEGGAEAVVDGLLDHGCTVMVPAFSSVFWVPAPGDQRLLRNGRDYDEQDGRATGVSRVYSPDGPNI